MSEGRTRSRLFSLRAAGSSIAPRRFYCTYFDSRYISRGLALYSSLLKHVGDFELWILCFDGLSYDMLAGLALPQVRLVALDEFERGDNASLAAKKTRSRAEYFFTCTPSWLLYVLSRNAHIDVLGYLDADLYFYSSPEPVYDELGNGSLLITAHDFPRGLRWQEQYGRFNVGLMLLKSDEAAVSALTWWRERCLEWCYDRVEEGRFADQKYLDQFPMLFPETRVMRRPAGAMAPWNWMNYDICWDRCHIRVSGQPLVTYHFQSVSLYYGRLYTTRLSEYRRMPGRLRRRIYGPYVRELARMEALVRHSLPRQQLLGPEGVRTTLAPRQLARVIRSGDAGLRIR